MRVTHGDIAARGDDAWVRASDRGSRPLARATRVPDPNAGQRGTLWPSWAPVRAAHGRAAPSESLGVARPHTQRPTRPSPRAARACRHTPQLLVRADLQMLERIG